MVIKVLNSKCVKTGLTMKTIEYRGQRESQDSVRRALEDGTCEPLSLRLDLRSHSPTGFSWGYWGSGPAQLALAILADYLSGFVFGDQIAEILYHPFKESVVGTLGDNWVLTRQDVAREISRAAIENEEHFSRRLNDAIEGAVHEKLNPRLAAAEEGASYGFDYEQAYLDQIIALQSEVMRTLLSELGMSEGFARRVLQPKGPLVAKVGRQDLATTILSVSRDLS